MSQEVSGKANANHTHTTSQISDIGQASVNYANSSGSANSANSAGSVPWSGVSGKPNIDNMVLENRVIADFNNAPDGITMFDSSMDIPNSPGVRGGILFQQTCFVSSLKIMYQIVVSYGGAAIYSRTNWYDSWSSWNAYNLNDFAILGNLSVNGTIYPKHHIDMALDKKILWSTSAQIFSNATQNIYFMGSTEPNYALHLGVHDSLWALDPDYNGNLQLGTPNHRWAALYAQSGTINTSDRNQKNTIQPLDDRYIQLFLKLLPVSFKFNNGTSGRTHIGFISQDVEAAMTEVGLTDLEFAGFCRDQKTVPVQKTTKVKVLNEETGKEEWQKINYTKDEPVEGEYVYSLRYEEFIALNTAVIQSLIKRVELLEKHLNNN